MPLFNYTCPDCGEKFEKLIQDPARRDDPGACPGCGREGAERDQARNISVGGGPARMETPPSGCGGCPGGGGGFT